MLLALLQNLVAWIVTTLFCVVVTLVSLVTFDARWRVVPAMIRWWGRTMLRLVRVRIDVSGAEHLAGRRMRVVVFNHASMLDAFIVAALLPPGGTAAVKREVLRYPGVNLAIWALGFVIIDRGHTDRARKSLARAAVRMRDEHLSVFIAPEGTRTRDGRLLPFRRGAFHLALDAGAPIVPLVLYGAGTLKPRGSLVTRPGTVRVLALPPVQPTYPREQAGAFADALRARYVAQGVGGGPEGPRKGDLQ